MDAKDHGEQQKAEHDICRLEWIAWAIEAARKHNRICQTGTQSRSNPGMIGVMEYLHSGKLGEVKLARGLCYKPRGSIGPRGTFDPPANVNYDLWCGPAPAGPVTRSRFHYDWHWQWDYGNGDLGNQGIHQMDLCRWALGENVIPASTLRRWMAGKLPHPPGDPRNLLETDAIEVISPRLRRIRLDRPVNLYLPEKLRLPGRSRDVTVGSLLNHTSGFEDRALGQLFKNDPRRVRPLELYLRQERPSRVRLNGAISSYSNYGAGLAGAAAAFLGEGLLRGAGDVADALGLVGAGAPLGELPVDHAGEQVLPRRDAEDLVGEIDLADVLGVEVLDLDLHGPIPSPPG